MSMVALDK